jgi:hypothetical protein
MSRANVGTSVRYAIADESVFALCEQVCRGLRSQLAEFQQILDAASRRSGMAEPDVGQQLAQRLG